MIGPRCRTGLAAVALCALLAACSSSAPQAPAAADRPAASTSAGVAATSAATPMPGNPVTTPRYRIDINLPELADAAVLREALQQEADQAKAELLQALPDPHDLPEYANRQLALLIDYKPVARTARFLSVRGSGMLDAGGAHPMPIQNAMVYDRKAQRVLAIGDLFADPAAAWQRLSSFSRNALMKKLAAGAPTPGQASTTARREWQQSSRDMIEQGTTPEAASFSRFVVTASPSGQGSGLLLIFPPYQVAPYVSGTQTVTVPAKVFRELLKPEYRADFTP